MPSFRLHATLFALASFMLSACSEAPPPAAAEAPMVTVAHPLKQNISDWDGFVGQFEAMQHVDVRPRVSGYLVEIAFEDGAQVKQGDLLFRIDPRPFEAVLDQARSQVKSVQTKLENAQTELERAKGLISLKAVSQEEFDALNATVLSAQSELDAARAAQRAAELDVEFTQVTAPVSGRLSYHRVDVGNIVKEDDTLLTTVVSVDPMRFSFQGSEAMLLRYKRQNPDGVAGAPVRIRLQDETDYAWDGKLEFFDNAIDAGSGTIRGRALVSNPDGFLVPGMFGHLQLQAAASYDGILLPDDAISTRGAQRIVFVVSADNVVSAQQVELGPLNSGLRVIRAGLTGDEMVVVSGLQRAFPGSTVQTTVTVLEAPSQP
jgi:RND family efflux transporter MFP subunit